MANFAPSSAEQRLAGKRALVTGAGRGLGQAIALAFAAEGANLVISYAASQAGAEATVSQAQARGVWASAVRADLASAEGVDCLARTALAALGGLDLLVNNAGLFSASPLLETDDALWERLLAINLSAPFRLARALAPALLDSGGVILNLASGGGQHPRPGYDTSPAYAASKAGLIMLSRRLALDLAPRVRVNCLAPGIVDSKPQPMSDAARARFGAVVPLARVGSPAEVAAAAVFLVSDESSFITGQVLNVDGGVLA